MSEQGMDYSRQEIKGPKNHFVKVDLRKANFYYAKLYDIDLSKANLTEADFRRAELHNIDFTESDLTNVLLIRDGFNRVRNNVQKKAKLFKTRNKRTK